MLLKTSAAAGALLLLALLGLWTSFHSRSSRAGRDHKALTGHVWHWVALLRCSVPFRVRGDHETWWQGFTRSKPLALRMVQTTHCWHVGRHGIATVCCVWWSCHVSSSIHSHWLRHNVGSTRHGPSLDRSGGHLVFHAAYRVLEVPRDYTFQLHKAWRTAVAASKQTCCVMTERLHYSAVRIASMLICWSSVVTQIAKVESSFTCFQRILHSSPSLSFLWQTHTSIDAIKDFRRQTQCH